MEPWFCLHAHAHTKSESVLLFRVHVFKIHSLWFWCSITADMGCAIAQAVSYQLPKAVAQVWAQGRSCGICGGQSGTGAGFLKVLRFPLSILITPTVPHSSFIIQGWYNRPNSGRRVKWTQSDPHPKKLKKNYCRYKISMPKPSKTKVRTWSLLLAKRFNDILQFKKTL
jgi:hypothetical protein